MNKEGKAVPESLRNTVAVRAAPSRTAAMVSCRKKGDEILVAEEANGWVRLSHEDDDWGWQRQLASESSASSQTKEAWMLVDGAEVGLGALLQKVF